MKIVIDRGRHAPWRWNIVSEIGYSKASGSTLTLAGAKFAASRAYSKVAREGTDRIEIEL